MKAVSLSLSRLEGDLQMAARAKGTIQQYLASIRRFEEFLCTEVGEANQARSLVLRALAGCSPKAGQV